MKKRFRKIGKVCIIFILIVGIFVLSPLYPFVQSMVVMKIFSNTNEKNSLLEETGMEISLPGGLSTYETDWYPFPMTYVANSQYERYTGENDAKLTILYNFPAFSVEGCSKLFDFSSPYYNGFYGAYVVRDSSNESLKKGSIIENVGTIASFDFFRLVLEEFGLRRQDEIFAFDQTNEQGEITFANEEGWTRLEANFTVNGASHQGRKGIRSYLQYGIPAFPVELEEFAPVNMHGIVYGKYFPNEDVGVYLYVMGKSETICKDCEQKILSNTSITLK